MTGGAGFIGSEYVRQLLSRPDAADSVTVLDALTYSGVEANLDPVRDNPAFRFHRGDIRDAEVVESALRALRSAVERNEKSMPYILEAVRAYATVQEISDTMKAVLGTYREPAFV